MRHYSAAVSMCLAVSCATTTAQRSSESPTETTAAAHAPQLNFENMLTREKEPMAVQQFSADGHTLSVEAAAPVQLAAGAENLRLTANIPLGTQTPLTCMVYQEAIDSAALLNNIITSIKDKVELLGVKPMSVDVFEKIPALFVEVRYATRTEPKAAGQLKLMVYAHDDAPVMCLLDEPGYMATFKRVSGSLAQSVGRAYEDTSRKAIYRSIQTMKMENLLVGFDVTTWVPQADGTVLVSSSVGLVPRGPVDWMSLDDVNISWADKDGLVRKEQSISVANGQLVRSVTLERKTGGMYSYQGELQGKPLKGEVKTKDGKGLKSDRLVAQQIVKTLLAGKKAELESEDYDAALDPTALTKVLVKKGANADDVTVISGGVSMQGQVDTAGLFKTAQMTVGPVTMKFERIFAEGPSVQ